MTSGLWAADWQTGLTELVSVNNAGQKMQGDAGVPREPSLSSDGRKVVFMAMDCNSGDPAPCATPSGRAQANVYLRDRDAGTTMLVTTGPTGEPLPWPATECCTGAISRNGRYAVFNSSADILSPPHGTICSATAPPTNATS